MVPTPTTLLDPLIRDLDKAKALFDSGDSEDIRADIIEEEFVFDQHKELREIVDDLMRLELERLEAAVARDQGKCPFI